MKIRFILSIDIFIIKIYRIMKKCKNCESNDAIKYSKYTSGNFCSLKCSRAYSTKEKRPEINKILSEKLTGRKTRNYYSAYGLNNNHKKSRIKKEYLNLTFEEKWKIINDKRKKTWNDKIMEAEYSTLSFDRLRHRVIIEQNGKCNKCTLSEWMGEPLTLELEHIDGNHHNNERKNIEALCPNCHSLTPTWRGRNQRNKNVRRVKDDELLKILIDHDFNMRQSLLSIGLAAKGGNYKRCHKLKREFEELNIIG
jgi:Zn finger protein HypA/HybF involved in hydrogenase expression